MQRARGHLARSTRQLVTLAEGVHPRELADGLGAALPALVDGSAIEVRLTLPDERFPAEIEAAVYFACAEALANAVKHARASTISIEVVRQGSLVSVVVCDDGVGGADPGRGGGITGLIDRFDTVGGWLRVEPRLPSGTRLAGTIPLPAAWRSDPSVGMR
jgi:signal transduction histidine kinase